jgi:hypothetical protein
VEPTLPLPSNETAISLSALSKFSLTIKAQEVNRPVKLLALEHNFVPSCELGRGVT